MKLYIITYHVRDAKFALGGARKAVVTGVDGKAACARLRFDLQSENLYIVCTSEQTTGVVQM